ncbi:MAG: M48 family peptidase [Anaerolineae bacterium]|nr:MAG: M48 family peptidase [Anaerolineae bacterium]
MAKSEYTVINPSGKTIPVMVQVDRRLKRAARWQKAPGGHILMRMPPRYSKRDIPTLLRQIEQQLQRHTQIRNGRTDADLKARADRLIHNNFNRPVHYRAIRWVGNMQQRLGSCTNGGATDGHIRLSDQMKDWPDWVVDYVIAHELMHRVHPDHSSTFWRAVRRVYPRTNEARAWIRGYFYAQGYADEGTD